MQTLRAGLAVNWPKYAFFAVVGVMAVFVLWNNERFLLDPKASEWTRYEPIRWHLLPHGLAGALALGLGALQFSSRVRRHRRIHRLTGKLYIAGVFIAGPMAIWMAFVTSPWFMIPFTITQAGVWMLFTGIAYVFIRRREIAWHREWMVRSYAIPLNFLEGRVIMAAPPLADAGIDAIVLVNWACLVLTLVATEVVLQWPRLFPRSTAEPRSEPAVG